MEPTHLPEPSFDESCRELLETLQHAMVRISTTGEIRDANAAMSRLVQLPHERLIGLQLESLYHPDDRAEALERRALRLAGRPAPVRFHRRMLRSDGAVVQVDAYSTPLVDDEGRIAGLLFEYSDVTDMLDRDRALARALEEEFTVLRVEPTPIVMIDAVGTILRTNRATEQVFGWSEEELRGSDVGRLAAGGDAERHAGYLRHYLEHGTASTSEGVVVDRTRPVRGRRRDGSTFPAALTVSEVPGRDADDRRFVGIIQDLTDRERAEAQLLLAQKSESLARLVAGVAHDFNNLLTVIGGSIELAQGRDAEADRWLSHAQAAADRAGGIVRQLLQYARRDHSELAPVDMVELVRETVSLLAQTVDRRITLDVHAEEEFAPVVVDRSQIEQVLMNLLVNARDAILERIETEPMLGGRISIDVTLRDDMIAIGVRDNGPGIPEAVAARVFDPFFTTKRDGRGTGLGLSMSYGIAKSHGGDLTVRSTPGIGTRFELLLPAGELPEPAPGLPAGAAPAGAAAGTQRLLVIDDEDDVISIAREMLEESGFTVVTAHGGRDGLDAFRGGEFDLVLVDVNMPPPGGWTTLEWLLAVRPEQRVLMVSGYCSDDEAREHGAVGVLHKPFHAEELIEATRRALAAGAPRSA